MKTNSSYLHKLSLAITLLLCWSCTVFGQLTGTKNIPGDYATISAAVTALNASGVGAGGVSFKVAANYTETITATISLTATGTAANPIVFQKDPATTGANPVITAYTTGVGTPATAIQDGIWRLVGSDYVTIDGIDVSDNAANTSNPSTMEYGYALYKASTSNGCQFVTIKNCVITLNNINNALGTAPMADGSTGIIVMNATAIAAVTPLIPIAGGTNSNNRFYSNTIQNCNTGIALIGYAAVTPFTLADTNNDIGGNTISTGNTIINYGGATAAANAAAAVRTLAQYGLNVSYNTINNNNGSGTNHPNTLRGIYTNTATSASATITYNTITLKAAATTQAVTGIENVSGSTAASNTISISNNSITNCTYNTATTGSFYGIYNNGATPASLIINNNSITNNAFSATSTGNFYGIHNSGVATTVTINSNTLSGNSNSALTTGTFYGIRNSAAAPVLKINSNTFFNNATLSTTQVLYPIYNSGTVTTSINIDSNNIGTLVAAAMIFNTANSGAQLFINNGGGGVNASLSISNNNFQGSGYPVAGSGNDTYISNTVATLSQVINGNTFTNLNLNTTGNLTFISNSVIVPATGTQNVNSNAIVGSFTKGAGGTITLFTSGVNSIAGSITNNNNNNFSNITVTGATNIAGWVNTDAGTSNKTIQNNTFSNWTGGTGTITAMSVNLSGSNCATTGNAINNISGAGIINGIITGGGNDKIYSNTINTLVSSGAGATVMGINVTAGTTKNIYQNTIYNLQGNGVTTGSIRGILISGGTTVNVYQNTIYGLQANTLTTGTVNGIWVSAGTTITIYANKIYDLSSSSSAITTGVIYGIQTSGATANSTVTIRTNLIGDLRTPSANAANPIIGIGLNAAGLTSVINVYNNTVYLNATSTGTNFGTIGIYHVTSTTATTSALDLRNNIITNTSVPNGTGWTIAYRRSSATLTNYASTSNNNLFYAGLAAANRLIFYDAVNSDQLLSTYKARVASRDAQSLTEDMITASKFISTTGSSASFLHLDPTKGTQAESGGISIAGITTDFDGQIIQGNTGYAGTGTAPDIGADEMDGIRFSSLSGTYNVGAGQTFTSLTNAGGLFANVNSIGLSGNVVVNITSDLTEDGSNVLYPWVEQGIGNYTLTIQPDASTARIISGNVLSGLIRFNGAKRVIINGSNGTANNYLTFRNTNTAGTTGTAFTFINGATNNTITYCNLEAYSNATNGVILFSTSAVAGGNSNNSISNCNINATVSSNTGNVCIYSAGTVGKENSTNTISNNNIYNYRDRGLDITATGSTAWTISGNSFYNGDVAGAINYAAGSLLHGIRILGGAGHFILNNYIGGNASLASGTNAVYASTLGIISFQGILLTTSAATPVSNIKGNTIGKISVSAVPTSSTAANVFIGIETNGSGVNIGGSLAGEGNVIGSNTANGSVAITTTTTNTTFVSIIRGINCNSTGGLITGNQVGSIDINNIGTAPAASTFLGIYVNSAAAPSPISNNIIGSTGTGAASNSIRVLSSSTCTSTLLTGISIGGAVTSSIQVSGNTIQNISHQSATASGSFTGINNSATGTAVVVITNNTISGNANNATAGIFYGIYNNNVSPATLTITSNTISGNSSTATGTGLLYGVLVTGTPPAISINSNTFSGNTTAALTTGKFVGIYAAANSTSLNINSNSFYGNATTSLSGTFFPIYNTGVVTTTININSNNIGTSTSSSITFNAANSANQVFINNTGGGAAAALSISNNNFQGITYAVAGTGANTYILNSATTLSQAINGNSFTNLNVNTAGSITFISDNVVLAATGTQNVNNNSIITGFTKKAGGTVTLFTSTSSSPSGAVINNNSNNFSNITVTGATTIAGWVNTDAGASTKTIQNNTFASWSCGTSAVTALSVSLTGTNNATTGNLINNISGASTITGITTGAGNDNIYSNTINTLSTTGAAAVTGIAVTAGTTKNIYNNKIYDLSSSSATGSVNGILVSGGTTVNVYNNLVGDLRVPAANSATDLIRGISVTSVTVSSAINVYFNTIYLNASSTGTTFGSSGVYHVVSGTASTATLNLRNNSITNTSTPKGAGLTVAYRRSGTALNNYASTSNNNLLYAGTPGTKQLIFSDGTNADQTITAYKSRVAGSDAQSITEDLTAKFLSTAGSSSVFLHMNSNIATAIESGAVNITGFTDDIDGQIRAGNTGYSGSSSSPDIGADEIFGIETIPPAITYTLLTNTTSTANRTVTGVTITDGSGVNITAGTKPRIYYKRFSDANVWLDNSSSSNGWKYTEATNSTSPFTFSIDYSLLYGGATVTVGPIQYFIVAQDIATTANIGINSGTFAATPSSVALTSTAFPIGGAINSYNIPFSGTYNVGATEIFTSLTKADGLFASINSAGLMGNTTFNITSDLTEDGTNALNQWTESGVGNYTMTIQPDAAIGRTISGNAAGGLIRLNGADRLTIDGSNSGSGSYLSFKNSNTAGTTGAAFTCINGATNNTIRYCYAEAYSNAANGVILFSTSTIAGGNSNNLIDHCSINATAGSNTGSLAIYSSGTVGKENSTNTISNNEMYNYRDRGIDITSTGSTGWSITGNSFYNGNVTGTINYAASSVLHGIRILGGSGYSILNNYIGGNTSLASGTNALYSSNSGNVSYQGILLTSTSATPASDIKGNTIAAITVSSVPTAANSNAFTGIETNGSGINIGGSSTADGNIIGSGINNGSIIINTSTTSITNTSAIIGINCISSGGVINNNQIGGFDVSNTGTGPASSAVRGIYVNNAAAPTQVNNNEIGSGSISNSIRILGASTATTTSLTGIEIGTGVNTAVQVNGNMIENISNLSTTSSGSFTGINNTSSLSSAVITISSDTIQNINSVANANTGSTVYAGIFSSSASTITNNIINNIALASTGTNAQVSGINVSGAYANTISNNTISNLSTASNKVTAVAETGTPAGSSIIGILNAATLAGQIISNNILYGFSATSTAGVNTVVTGIGITATVSGNIFSNRIVSLTNVATGTAPAICGIMAANGSFNVYNNAISISNSTNVNGIKAYGIVHASGASWNYYHNSVRIAGNATGTALRSAAFARSVAGALILRNNVFVNTRTGTGSNYGISNIVSPPANSWTNGSSDYNDLYSSNLNTAGEWGNATNQTFAQWQASSGADVHSVNSSVSFIPTVYDLEPDNTTNGRLNNSAIPITSPIVINTDINNVSRSGTAPDMGAYEFNYISFTVTASNNSPICSGDSVTLSVNPGDALNPTFSWSNPANIIISTIQNPTIAAIAGQYKVTVTDGNGSYVSDSTLVAVNPRPTARITSQTSLCDSGYVNLNISVTGTGLISGTLSNGDNFSGRAPLIIAPVFVTGTSSYNISSLSDSTCTAIPDDIPDTVTIVVTHKGDWLGNSSNWSDPVNWCEGILPTSSTDVNIPPGTLIMPIITGSVNCNSLTINTGDTLTIAGTGTLNIAGTLTNYGVYTDNGTTAFNGTSGPQTFSVVTTFNNLTLNNTSGLLLPAAIVVNNNLTITAGILTSNNFNIAVKGNWTNNVSTTGFAAGTAMVTFNGTTAQAIGGTYATSFNQLTIANTLSTVTLNANVLITGDLSISNGTFDLGGFTANRASAGGTLSVSNNATLKIGGTNTYPTNYSTNTLVVASTVEYSGTNQTVSNQLYGNLKLSGSGGTVVKTFPATALAIVGNLSSISGAATSVSFTAASNITINGNVSIGASTTFNGGSYSHSIGGSWVNSGTFTGNTGTIIFTGSGAVVSGSGTQNFNNLTIAASGVGFSAGNISLTGNLATTGAGSFSHASGGTLVMTGSGTTISGFGISLDNLTISGSVSTTTSLNLTGNLTVSGTLSATGGTITMSGISKTISGSGAITFNILSAPGSISANTGFSIRSSLNISGIFSATAGTATFTGTSSLSGTANLYNITINGTSLQLSAGSILGIANTLSITSGVLDVSSSGPNTVSFNGVGAQNVNGITYSNLVLSNGNTKTAMGGITTAYDITIGAGTTFDPSTYTHSIYGDWVNNGTFIPGASTVQFVGPANAYMSGVTSFNILTINASSSTTELVLQDHISAAIVNMTNGVILTGSDTLTITNTRTGNGIILGNIQRIHAFTTGVAYAFEGPDNTISFSSLSAVSSITVSVTDERISDFPFGGSINREYDINVPAGTYNATLRLHYEDDELNGNNESSMGLWDYNGSSWNIAGKTANSSTLDYVEKSGLTNITKRWTISDATDLVQWNGSVSTDWNTAANWTVLQGSGSRPPSSSDIVDLGTAAFINQPTISNDVTVKSITFGSNQAVTLTLGSSGSLTTLGDITGIWSGNAIHTINVNDQSLTVNGDIDLSDGISGHAINLNIGSGTVTTLRSLTEAGGANIHFSGAGTLNIDNDFRYSSGTFTAGNGTVVYSGTENQDVANITYNNLTVDKASGIATIDSAVNIAGDLLVSSGELDNFSTIRVSGNVSINAGSIFQNNDSIHVGGNWTNSGTYVPIGSSIFFDGSGTQYISASTFGNLNINKPSGTAILTGDVTISGNLIISSGTLDFQTYFINRNVIGGVASIADGATAIIGGNNGPSGFSTNTLGAASTVIFNGTDTQYLLFDGISFGNIIFRNAGTKILSSPVTVNGDLTIESGADFDAGTNTITLNGNWINNGTFIPSTSTIICSGIGKTIFGNTTFNNVTVTGSYTGLSDFTFNGLVNVTHTGSLSSGATIHTLFNGDLINSGVVYALGTTTLSCNVVQHISFINAATTVALRVIVNGSVSPVVNSTSSPQFGYITINNTAGVNPSVGWTILYSLTVGSGASFNGGNSTHNILGSVTNNGTITSTGTLNFMPSSAVALNLGSDFSSTGTVVFGGAGAISLAGTPVSFHDLVISNTNAAGITPSSDWNITNNLTVNSGSVLHADNHAYLIGGNISNIGTINSGTSGFTLNGIGTQDIHTVSAFNDLTINKPEGLVTLSSNATVNGVLNFVAGTIQTGSNNLILPSSGTVTGADQSTGWVNGKLQKYIATGTTSKIFETGDANNYAPVTIAFTSVTTAGNITANTTSGDHPAILTSDINASKSVNRYWTLTNNAVVATSYSPTFSFVADDIDADADPANFVIQKYDGSSWYSTTTGSRTGSSTQATGVTSFSDFQIGELSCIAPSISSDPLVTQTVCQNAGSTDLTVTASGDDLSYQWYSNTINSNIGGTSLGREGAAATYTPSTETAGVFYYYVVVTGDCGTAVSEVAEVIVNPLPIAYDVNGGGAYCANSNGVTVNLSNSETGVSYQLVLDGIANMGTPKTGTGVGLNFNNETAEGEYSIMATNIASGCTQIMNGSVTVSINPVLPVSFSGLDASYCVTADPVILTGTPSDGSFSGEGITGDTFSPSAAGTGGPYTITYSYTNEYGCTSISSQDVTVIDTRTAAPNTIYGPVNSCPFVGADTVVTYTVRSVPGNITYQWSIPDSMILVSGQGDTAIHVKFLAGYNWGNISVKTSSSCGYSIDSTMLWVETLGVHAGGGISGTHDVCNYIGTGDTVTYSISNVLNVKSLNWTVPAGVTIISGQTDSVLRVTYSNTFINGRISVIGANECSSFTRTTLLITRYAPDKPIRIYGPIAVCKFIDRDTLIRYYVESTPRTSSYNWVLPTGITLMSGQGDTAIYVKFLSSFITGTSISVSSVAPCGSSPALLLYLNRKNPVMPVSIAGPTDACPLMNTSLTAIYSINRTAHSTSYNWSVPAGATIVSGQGDTSIVVQYNPSFLSGNISVTAMNNCGNSAARTLAITRKLPAMPGIITGPIDACPLMNTQLTATYFINPVANSTSYAWTVPAGASIVSGQGDTIIQVSYSSSFISGAITVKAVNNCASGGIRSLTISRKLPAMPGAISGITDICPIIGTQNNATYVIRKVMNATSYAWTVPAGASIVSGQGDSSIRVNYSNSFTSGSVTVSAVVNCGSSAPRSIIVAAKAPATPGAVTGPLNVCTYFMNHSAATYTVSNVIGANHYSWAITGNMTIQSASPDSSSVTIIFNNGFTMGSLSARSISDCGGSAARILSLVTTPLRPFRITASAPACQSTIVGYKASTIAGATNYIWTIPANGATLLNGAGSDSITISYSSSFTSGTITVKASNACGSSLATSLAVSSSACRIGRSMVSFTNEEANAVTKVATPVATVSNIYPNPNNGNFTIRIQTANNTDNARIQVIDLFGGVVLELKGVNDKGIIQVDISDNHLPSGLYTVRYIIDKEVKYIKMVVQK